MGITKILSILIGVVVTIITLAFVGAYIVSVFSGTKEVQAASELSTVISNVQGLYASQPNFSGLTNTVAIQGGVYPTMMATLSSTSATDPWGGNVTVEANSTNNAEFTVEFDDVPEDSCTKLASSYNSTNLVSLSIDGNNVTAFNPATLSSACNTAAAPITMIWTLN
jgi:flagellar basal body-associated protein FliL